MSATPEANPEEAKLRAEWLNKHKAPQGWLILTESELATIREEFSAIERERDEARDVASGLAEQVMRLRKERDEAMEQLEKKRLSSKGICQLLEQTTNALRDMMDRNQRMREDISLMLYKPNSVE